LAVRALLSELNDPKFYSTDPIIATYMKVKESMIDPMSSPWIYEKRSARFIHQGLHCHIHRNFNGALCGYVKVPKKVFKKLLKRYDGHYCLPGVQVHGGVSFIGKIRYGEHGRVAKSGYYIGFDCDHYPDYTPYGISAGYNSAKNYRTWGYVENETRQLADQLLKFVNANS
jgi:hypothetical protein